ncbi:MAG: TatD family hydrolase [Dethiobacter sp.]|jgi:TatD DNase family protein|nr:TatD family hydrolase [Dethiobacter sp.]
MNAIRLIDSHAHLNDNRFRQDVPQVIERAKKAGVEAIINVGFDVASSQRAVNLAGRHAIVYAAVGVHPHDAANEPDSYLSTLRDLAGQNKVVAVGEMGLDFYRNLSPPQIQKRVFREQIRLARELSLPVIIHDRDAHSDVLTILKEERAQETGGVLHCFSGDTGFARSCLQLGFYISIAGTVTYNKEGILAAVARMVPADKLLVETDAPYLAPVPQRGKRNEPAFVLHTVEYIAMLRGEEAAQIAALTAENARKLFRLQ